jgi:hypothetical protein
MKYSEGIRDTVGGDEGFAVDTTFVVFFLGLELGRSLLNFGFDGVLLGLTLAVLVAVPYFYMPGSIRPDLAKWLFGRSLIAALAVVVGVAFQQSLGVVIPDMMRFLPMTLLIGSAMISCYVQFYGLLNLRPAK